MQALPDADVRSLFEGEFKAYREEEWVVEWRQRYVEQVRRVRNADERTWCTPAFQQNLWEDAAVASIGPGQSVTLVGAYTDEQLAVRLFEARQTLTGVPLEQRGIRLEALYDTILNHVYPRYTPRRPKARIARLIAAMFPDDMTCLMDATRLWGVQRVVGAQRVPGDFIAQHPSLRARIREIIQAPPSLDESVDQAIFAWFIWQTIVDRPDEGAVVLHQTRHEASDAPTLSLLPANSQRRSLTCVADNISLLVAMVREAEHGINREDLVGVILAEATQLNYSSAGNMISQAMGGLGLIRLDDNAYRPTERGQQLLTAADPAQVLRAPLVGRVFGMGHLLLMVRREPGKLRATEAAKMLQRLVPTWTSIQPGSHIIAWAKLVGLVQSDTNPAGPRLILTEDGEDYAAALPADFEARWTIAASRNSDVNETTPEPTSQKDTAGVVIEENDFYGVDEILAEGCFLGASELRSALNLLTRKRNVILQGPPGTGKTWLAKRLGYALLRSRNSDRLSAVQFQPSLSYEDFVRGWRPDGKGGLRLADGALLDAVNTALADTTRPYVMVIEEINRGNPAQIFGEFLTLIEDSKRNKEESLRPAYPLWPGERIYVPENFYLIGTMNLADRSLALVDLALRRRFAFITLKPLFGERWRKWCIDHGAPSEFLAAVAERLMKLNNAISEDRSLGAQFQIGHSFLTPTKLMGATASEWKDWYLELIRSEITPLLSEYWYDDASKVQSQLKLLDL